MSAHPQRRSFRGAMRHSRRVRRLRVAIPTAVVLCIVVLVLFSYLNPLRFITKLPADLGNLVISGTKITMESPRLAGFTRDSRGYELSARSASQDLKKPDVLELDVVRAKVQMPDKEQITLTAATGVYDTKAEMLSLRRDIVLITSNYTVRLSEAEIDIRKGHIVSEKPVEVVMEAGTLSSKRLEVFESGEVVRFEGGVTMNLSGEAVSAANPGTAKR